MEPNNKKTIILIVSASLMIFMEGNVAFASDTTVFIRADSTGGDCLLIGIWNMSTKVCTLTQDVSSSMAKTIEIDDDGITLDGNSHIIEADRDIVVVSANGRNNIIIKNLNIIGAGQSILLSNVSGSVIQDNTFTSGFEGVRLLSSTNNIVINNIFTTSQGISSFFGSDNTIAKNIIDSGLYTGIGISDHNDIIRDNVISNFSLPSGSGIIIGCISPGTTDNAAIFNNTLTANYLSLYLCADANNNKVYNNNFLGTTPSNNANNFGDGNVFNLSSPIGGNYWNGFATPEQGCVDINQDGFCDLPYVGINDRGRNIPDNFPYVQQNGWSIPKDQPPLISNLAQFKSDSMTPIQESTATIANSVTLKAMLSDPDNDQVKLEVELKAVNQPFDEMNLIESSYVASGNIAVVTSYNLISMSYHWRARAVDDRGTSSSWEEFGVPGNVDFVVKTLEEVAADLAKELVNSAYLYGGKGWDYNQSLFVSADVVKTGYTFWDQTAKEKGFGSGVDCSGLVMWAYNRSFDQNKSRFQNFVKTEGADEQYRYNTMPITESELKPGDVMFFDWDSNGFIDHVAMYVGGSGGYDVVSATNRIQGIEARLKDQLKQLHGFRGFKRVISTLPPAIIISTHSPVDLTVTDPDGFTVTPTTVVPSNEEYLREIPATLYYSEIEQGTDGNPIDQVYSYALKAGDYKIKVISETGVPPTSTYILDVLAGGQSITLAQNVPISQIPSNGYGVTRSATGILSTFIPVAVDIKPGGYPNSINLKSNGAIPVVVLGSATFDVKQIDPITVKLANALVRLKGNGQPMADYEDVNGDSFTDLVVQVPTQLLQLTASDTKANLTGQLKDGAIIKGSDSVRIVP